MLKQDIDQELKQAMLAADKMLTETLRTLKSSILYAEVSQGKRETGLSDEEIQEVLRKESKKRKEAADMYATANETEREQLELYQKGVIDKYLPAQLSDEQISAEVSSILEKSQISPTQENFGKIMSLVRDKIGSQAEGSTIASAIKKIINQQN